MSILSKETEITYFFISIPLSPLRISGMAVGKCVDRGKKIDDNQEIIKEYFQ